MLLDEVAGTSAAVAASSARLAKVERLAACLRRLEPGEVHPAVAFLSGDLRQRQIRGRLGGPARRPDPAPSPPDRDRGRRRLRADRPAGRAGSQTERRRLVASCSARATASEQRFLIGLLSGELRQGALEVMVEAIARAAGVPRGRGPAGGDAAGALGPVAEAALAGRARAAPVPPGGRPPRQPMLASTAPSIEAAMERVGEAAVEWTGRRPVQVHRDGTEVAVFTRTLDDITARVPEVVAAALALPVRSAVLDGEVIALHPDGRPHPFQVTASRVGSRLEVERLAATLPLTPSCSTCSTWTARTCSTGRGRSARRHGRRRPRGAAHPRTVTADPARPPPSWTTPWPAATGRDGQVAGRDLGGRRRGAGWLKVKPVHTLDLVVLAAEWGHGRRRGWLSNLHLGARDPAGGFVMLGKTFKGLTDKLLTWQTERLLELAVGPTDGYVVHVRPELVVEIAFDGLQTSPRYPGGLACASPGSCATAPTSGPRSRHDPDGARASTLTTGTRDISCISRNAIYRGRTTAGRLDDREPGKLDLDRWTGSWSSSSRGRSASSAATTGPPWVSELDGSRCGSARRTGR